MKNPLKSIKMYRFCVKHPTRAFVLLSIGMTLVYTVALLCIHSPIWLIVLLDAMFIFLNFAYVKTADDALVRLTIKPMHEQCDPDPFLGMTEELLTYKATPMQKQARMINYCVALQSVGEYQKAYDLLSQVNIDKNAGTPSEFKLVYYHNLGSLCENLDKLEQAKIWYEKAVQIHEGIAYPKVKEHYAPTTCSAKAELAFLAGEYHDCIKLLQEPSPTAYGRVYRKLTIARALIALGEVAEAKNKLIEVINEGNKLYCVTEARELLNTLE